MAAGYLVVDIIGSKILVDDPGGGPMLRTLREEMRRFLDSELHRPSALSVTPQESQGDNIRYQVEAADFHQIADITLSTVIAAFDSGPNGKRFRYLVYSIEADTDYLPRIAAFDRISKEDGKNYHIAIEQRVHSELTDTRIIGWLRGMPHLKTKVPFQGESSLGANVHLYCSVGEDAKSTGPLRVTIDYGDLLDPNAVVWSGQKLTSALRDDRLRGAVQPFVDRYSELLPAALEMITGPDDIPCSTVIDLFPNSKGEPAWVAILRGGRIHMVWNGKTRVKIFLLGDNAKQAYSEQYSVIRHCLGILSRLTNKELQIDIFAYLNDYTASQLRLNSEPYSISASSFDSITEKTLDLEEFVDFFAKGSVLTGGRLRRDGELIGLLPIGKKGSKQTVAGEPVTISDLAVAYRAVFHAGDNEAFVSIDQHQQPTKSKVNFGGFLENTRIGRVLLEADKRFKTISCGLDPNTFIDLRRYTRERVPGFLTSSERYIERGERLAIGKWIGMRLWYYFDKKRHFFTDPNYETLTIENPHFIADAERSREDFASPKIFEEQKKDTLPPSQLLSIEHLNRYYSEYSDAFQELSELDTVVRLLGFCAWLYKARPSWLDLGELLSVELPPCFIETELPRLIAATFLSHSKQEVVELKKVKDESEVLFITPILDETVQQFFGSPDRIEDYLTGDRELTDPERASIKTEALVLFDQHKDARVRDILRSEEDVRLFANYAYTRICPGEARELENQINEDAKHVVLLTNDLVRHEKLKEEKKTRIEELSRMADAARRRMEELDLQQRHGNHDQLVQEQTEIVTQYERMLNEYERDVNECDEIRQQRKRLIDRRNDNIARLNSLKQGTGLVEIGGGVDANPKNFLFELDASNPKLIEFRRFSDIAGPEYTEMPNLEKWVTSKRTAIPPKALRKPSITAVSEQAAQINRSKASANSPGSWTAKINVGPNTLRERFYDAQKKELWITEFRSDGIQEVIVGSWESSGRIAFRRPLESGGTPNLNGPHGLKHWIRSAWRRFK